MGATPKRSAILPVLILGCLLALLCPACPEEAALEAASAEPLDLGYDAFVTTDVGDVSEDTDDTGPADAQDIDPDQKQPGDPCNPLEVDTCPGGLKCVISIGATPRCLAEGDRQLGETCSLQAIDDCASGLVCAQTNPDEGLICHPFCSLNGALACVTGGACTALPFFQGAGICVR